MFEAFAVEPASSETRGFLPSGVRASAFSTSIAVLQFKISTSLGFLKASDSRLESEYGNECFRFDCISQLEGIKPSAADSLEWVLDSQIQKSDREGSRCHGMTRPHTPEATWPTLIWTLL